MNNKGIKLTILLCSLLAHLSLMAGDGERMRHLQGSEISNQATMNMIYPVDFPLTSDVNYSTKVSLVYGREQRTDYEGHPDWSIEVFYTLTFYTRDYQQIGTPVTGNSLKIFFNMNSPTYEAVKLFDDLIYQHPNVKLTITNVVRTGTVPEDIRLELGLLSSCEHVLGSLPVLGRNGSELYWSYQHGAKYYQVEWVYLDAEDQGSAAITTGTSAFNYKKGIRVTTSDQHYQLNLTYPEGRVFYRIRGIGYWVNTGSVSEKMSAWVYGSSPIAINSNSPANDPKPFETSKTWQYSATYVEDGKYSKSMSYFDGSFRQRQELSNVVSDTTTIISESKYDYEGRAVVSILPAPIKGNDLSYHKNFNQFETPTKGKNSYDNNNVNGAEKLLTASGASRYYSSNNDVETLHRDYLPDAEGYPFSQVEYLRDGTGRIARASNVGNAFRLKDPTSGPVHYVQNIYGNTNETELRRLFGSNVGEASHYSKNAVIDPDGQISVSYLDMQGRVIATALAGGCTPNHYQLDEYASTELTVNLDAGNGLDMNNLISRSQNYITNTVINTIYTFKYDMKGVIAKLAEYDNSLCADCRYDLVISVKDPDGIDVPNTPIVRNNLKPSSLNCTEVEFEYEEPSFDLTFAKIGSYTVTKELRLAGDSYARIEQIIESSVNYPSVEDILLELNNNLDLTQCDYTCEQHCRSKVLEANPGLTGQPLDDAVAACVATDCQTIANASLDDALDRECEAIFDKLKEQVSPGGYYYTKPTNADMNAILLRTNQKFGSNWPKPGGGIVVPPVNITQLMNADNYNSEWTYFLAQGHYEICHYDQCTTAVYKQSKRYDIDLTRIPDWVAADNVGLLQPYDADPYFNSSPGSSHKTSIINWMGEYYNEISNEPSNCTLYPNNVEGNPNFCGDVWDYATSAHAFSGTVPTSEQSWQLLQSIYRQKKKEIMVNATIQSGCTYQPHEEAVVPNPLLSNDPAVLNNQALQGLADLCNDNTCYYNVDKWMTRIEYHCGELQDIDSSYIADQLELYCPQVCGKTNPFGAVIQGTLNAYPSLIAIQDRLNANYNGCSLEEAIAVPNPYIYSTTASGELIVSGYSTCPGEVPYAEGDIPGYGPNIQPNSTFASITPGWNIIWWRDPIVLNGLPSYINNGFGHVKLLPYNSLFSTVILQAGKTYRIDFDIINNPDNAHPLIHGYDDGNYTTLASIFTGATTGHQTVEFVAPKTGVVISTDGSGTNAIVIDNFTIREKLLCGDGRPATGSFTLNNSPIFLGPEETVNGSFQQNGIGWYDNNDNLITNYFEILNDESSGLGALQEQSYSQSVNQGDFVTPSFTNGISWEKQVWNINNSGVPFLYSPGMILTSALPDGKILTGDILTIGKTYRLSFNTYYAWLPPGKNPYDVHNGSTLILANNFNSSPVYHHDYNRPFTVDFVATDERVAFTFYDGRQIPSNFISAQLMRMGNVSIREILPATCFNVLEDATPLLSTCVPFTTDAATTLNNLATALNAASTEYDFTVDNNKLLISGKPGTGESQNGKMLFLVADTNPSSLETDGYKICSSVTMAGGVASGKCCDDLFTFEVNWEDERQKCIQQLQQENEYKAIQIWTEEVEALKNELIQEYYQECFANPFEENFSYTFHQTEYHYTLYYYDQAGNLVMTVPPAGVNPLTDVAFDDDGAWIPGNDPQHYLLSKNKYNTSNQTVWRINPDAGESYFVYDRKNQLRLSQDGKQRANSSSGINKYSYLKTDYLGRSVEAGQLENFDKDYTYLIDVVNTKEVLVLLDNIGFPDNSYNKNEVIETIYSSGVSGQENLRNRVSKVLKRNSANNIESSMLYSYDIRGNTKLLEQYLLGFGSKVINYEYDLLSGKVDKIIYQKNQSDQFIHKYDYDVQNRLIRVQTSREGIIWEEDVRYFYNKNGLLGRKELGQDKVQANDYFYTLNGSVKGVNLPNARRLDSWGHYGVSIDVGKDGIKGAGLNAYIARDEFAYSLGFYQGDYKPVNPLIGLGAAGEDNWNSGQLGTAILGNGQYKGNISYMVTQTHSLSDELNNATYENNGLRGQSFKYDQLNRLKEALSFSYNNTGSNVNWKSRNTLVNTESYDASYSYDPNGNILRSKVNSSGVVMDDLDYHYDYFVDGQKKWLRSNRLYHVTENALLTTQPDDIEVAPVSFTANPGNPYHLNPSPGVVNNVNNFSYDVLGNLIKDKSEEIDEIVWTINGKIKEVNRKPGSIKSNLEFKYDAFGNRIAKIVKPYNFLGNPNGWQTTYYVHDAAGNIIASYDQAGPVLSGVEHGIFGNERLGVVAFSASDIAGIRKPAQKKYELGNHLGNIYVVLSAWKLGRDTATIVNQNYISPILDNRSDYYFAAQLSSITDYYPFGASIYDRSVNDSYRYGFNGKEKDVEGMGGGGSTYDYGFRIYNPNLGRFLSNDPLASQFPWWTPYQYAGNCPVWAKDLDGLESDQPTDPNQVYTPSSYLGTVHPNNQYLDYDQPVQSESNVTPVTNAEARWAPNPGSAWYQDQERTEVQMDYSFIPMEKINTGTNPTHNITTTENYYSYTFSENYTRYAITTSVVTQSTTFKVLGESNTGLVFSAPQTEITITTTTDYYEISQNVEGQYQMVLTATSNSVHTQTRNNFLSNNSTDLMAVAAQDYMSNSMNGFNSSFTDIIESHVIGHTVVGAVGIGLKITTPKFVNMPLNGIIGWGWSEYLKGDHSAPLAYWNSYYFYNNNK